VRPRCALGQRSRGHTRSLVPCGAGAARGAVAIAMKWRATCPWLVILPRRRGRLRLTPGLFRSRSPRPQERLTSPRMVVEGPGTSASSSRIRVDPVTFAEIEAALRERLEALPPAARAELPCLRLPDFDRAEWIGDFRASPETRTFGELLIDLEENKPARAVVFVLLAGMERN
jgi:hypothetical protein